jgi:hypothetical protein
MVAQVIASVSGKKKEAEIENAIHGQAILSPEQAKEWGIVQEIRTNFMEPGAVFVSVNNPVPVQEKKSIEYTTLRPTVSAGQP